MGIDLYCGKYTFGCSYTGWHYLRCNIIEATLKYLENIIIDYKKENTGDNNEYNEDRYQFDIVHEFLTKIKIDHEKTKMSSKEDDRCIYEVFMNVIEERLFYLDGLIYFDVGGLFSLCKKSDCQGFYSSGNSIDIINLLNVIKPFLKELDEDTYNAIYENQNNYGEEYAGLYKLFETSCEKDILVTIS